MWPHACMGPESQFSGEQGAALPPITPPTSPPSPPGQPAPLAPHRTLGKTGVKVPLIGYGTSPLGKEEKVAPKEAVRLLNYAIDRGVTYLDTSPSYGSEPHIGEVMKDRRQEVFLATKVDNRSKEGVL